MSGLPALRGFDYQVTVILDQLLARLGQSGHLIARPEGRDDLVFRGLDADPIIYVQIKKPREDEYGRSDSKEWSIPDVCTHLLSDAVRRLTANEHRQEILLGDPLSASSERLFAPTSVRGPAPCAEYWHAVHLLARNMSKVTRHAATNKEKVYLDRWHPSIPDGTPDPLSDLAETFCSVARSRGVEEDILDEYRNELTRLESILPSVLARPTVHSTYGREAEVRDRIRGALANRFGLELDIVGNTLVNNLRAFIQDVSTEHDRWLDREELELEVRHVWPRMNLVTRPPTAEEQDIARPEVVDKILAASALAPLAVVGASGSGKTKIAAECVRTFSRQRTESDAYYVPVRREHQLRDVLAGLAFHLRRQGFAHPFSVTVDPTIADEEANEKIVQALASSDREVFVAVDLVEGDCGESFAEELAALLQHLCHSKVQVAFLGQRSAFRKLSDLEKKRLEIAEPIEMPGLDFESFRSMCEAHSVSTPQRTDLWDVFEKLTGGRSAGLLARLADAVAKSGSLDRMQELSAMGASAALRAADADRYRDIPEETRKAADRIVCFSLPFRLNEAVDIFPDERIREACREMLDRGLLRAHGEDLYEMHETIRAGLEDLLPPAVLKETHMLLSAHYLRDGQIVPAVFHLSRGGDEHTADTQAKKSFLHGRHRAELAAYVGRRRLLSWEDLEPWVTAEDLPDEFYVLPRIIRDLGDTSIAEKVLEVVRASPSRCETDYRWAWWVAEIALASDSRALHALLCFSLEVDGERRRARLDMTIQGANRSNLAIETRTIELFKKQDPETKWQLARLFLSDVRTEPLQAVLRFLYENDWEPEEASKHLRNYGRRGAIPLRSDSEVLELLAALPTPEVPEMLLRYSVLFGGLAPVLWELRDELTRGAVTTLQHHNCAETAAINALRVLIFFGDPRALKLGQRFWTNGNELAAFSMFLPALLPAHADISSYQQKLFDQGESTELRTSFLNVLLHLGVSGDDLAKKLLSQDVKLRPLWEFLLATHSIQHPFRAAIPLVEELLVRDDKAARVYAPAVLRLGQLSGDEVDQFLRRTLRHGSPAVRMFSALALQQRRNVSNLDDLLAALPEEPVAEVRAMLVSAVLASNPRSVRSLQCPDTDLTRRCWTAILAGRLSDSAGASDIVSVACDTTLPWRSRRAAILAAGRLPYEDALAKIYPVVMAERTRFFLDKHHSLLGHNLLTQLLESEARAMFQRYGKGRSYFVDLFGDILEHWRKNSSWTDGSPTGEQAIDWLFDELAHVGWPEKPEAYEEILNSLHVPILQAGVVRALRLTNRSEEIEGVIASTDSLWLLSRALCECFKGRKRDSTYHQRISSLAARNPLSSHPSPTNILKNSEPAKPRVATETDKKDRVETWLNYSLALEACSKGGQLPGVLVLHPVNEEQAAELVAAADPARDPRGRAVPTSPRMTLTKEGYRVGGTRVEAPTSGIAGARKRLRPAVVASLPVGTNPSWHRRALARDDQTGATKEYLMALIDSIAIRNDRDRLAYEFEANGDLLLNYFDDIQWLECCKELIDARQTRSLMPFADVGTDQILVSMCHIASWVKDESVDPFLRALFLRWVRRFDPNAKTVQHDNNRHIWRAFNALSAHPRFTGIPNYDLRLMELLPCKLTWYSMQHIVDVLCKCPRAYVSMESRLLQSAPFEHFHYDEVDRLDDSCQELFRCTNEAWS